MAYIGNTSAYSGFLSIVVDQKRAVRYQASSSFTAKYMAVNAVIDPDAPFKLAIYADNAGEPSDLLGTTVEFGGSGNRCEYFVPLSSPVSITSGTYYWLAFLHGHTSSISVGYSGLTGGTGRYNSDTYSDGFADPFGSASSVAHQYIIYATDEPWFAQNTDLTSGGLDVGGAHVTASDGTKVAIIPAGNAAGVILYKEDSNGYLVYEDGANGVDIWGASALGHFHAAIDSSDNIHIVAACTSEQTRDVAYAIATYSAGSWTIGSWEEIASYTEAAPTYPGVAISIDSNDKPHVLFVDAVKVGGSTQDNVYYTEKTGASWATPTQIGDRDVKTDYYRFPSLTLRNSDYIEALYRIYDGEFKATYKAETGSGWPTETHYASDVNVAMKATGLLLATTGGTVYRFWRNGASDYLMVEDGTTLGYDCWISGGIAMHVVLVNDSERYVLYVDGTDRDVDYLYNSGSGWTYGGTLQTGTYDKVIAEWAYNNENQSGEINYIFEASGTIYYASLPLPTVSSVPSFSTVRKRLVNQFLVR